MREIEAGQQLVERRKPPVNCFCGHVYEGNHSERWGWKRGIPLWTFHGKVATCTDCRLCKSERPQPDGGKS